MAEGAPPLLSVCLIVKDEEPVIGGALASVARLGDDVEIVVVDTGSKDRTVAIAEAAGAKTVHFAWIGDFSAARNFGFGHARGAWLFVLDADEEVTPEMAAGLRAVLTRTKADGIRIPVRNVDDGGRVLTSASSTRFVRNGRGHRYVNPVHEDIEGPILRAGGTLEDADLPLLHHGYTAEESTRKDRHARNLALVHAAHAATPEDPRHWHYLGLELAIGGEHAEAAPWFERVVTEHPRHPLAGWSASQLGAIRLADRRAGEAWRAFDRGRSAPLGRVTCLLQLGRIAVREGDGLSALAYADALDALDARPRVEGDVARRREATLVLRAEAMMAGGDPEAAFALLKRGVTTYPNDGGVGDAIVRVAERIHGARRGAVVAVAETNGARSVLAGALSAFARVRAWREAVSLGEQHGVTNEARAHALFRVGRTAEAFEMLASFGESAAVHALVLGLEAEDEVVIAAALARMPPAAARAFEAVRRGAQVTRDDAWLVLGALDVAVLYRADAMAERLAASLPMPASARAAQLALAMHDAGEPTRAFAMALTCADEPDAREVIGLVSLARGDLHPAAMLLQARLLAGEASVRVYAAAATALVELGRLDEARDVVTRGLATRPLSRTLAEMARLVSREALSRAPPLAKTGS